MSDPMIGLLLLAILFVFLAGGLWIALSLTGLAVVALTFFSNAPVGLVMATTFWGHSHSWSLTALPLFILMGEILLRSRLSRDMFNGLRLGWAVCRDDCCMSTFWAAPFLPPCPDPPPPPQQRSAKCRSQN